MADQPAACPRCGARLVRGSPLGGLCPGCLVMLAVGPQHQPQDGEAPGTTVGPYQLLEKVGEGGMGVVFRAQQERPIRRVVALKVMKPGGGSRQVLSRFESERQAVAILNHPNIATVFDAGVTSDGRPYFVMEYVPGLPITAFADQHALAIPARLELFLQVCDGVEHAHQKGLIHRDLKPTNILVADRDGRPVVKIIDFGVAKAVGPQLTDETIETQVGALLGTPEYMSPEQAGLTESEIDTRTDIYSLGLVLYELLVGALPFDARELRRRAVIEMLRIIREEDPPRLTLRLNRQSDAELQEIAGRRLTEPRRLVRRLRGDLEWITARALEKDPARRYPSASELRADLHRHLSNEPVIAGPPDLRYRLGKLARKHRTTAAAASVAVAALLVGAIVSTALWISADQARRENRERLKTLHVTTGLQLANDGEDLKALPWLVRALQLEEGGPRAEELHRIRIRHELEGSPSPIRLWHHAGLVGASLGPDRTTLATWDRQGSVRIWDATRGENPGPALQHPAPIVDVRPSESIVVTADQEGTIRIWDARTGQQRLTPLTHGRALRFLRISASANRLLSADDHGGVRVWALDSGRLLTSVVLERGVTSAEFLAGGQRFAAGIIGGPLAIVDAGSGRIGARLNHEDSVVSIRQLSNGRMATTTADGVVRVWDLERATAEFESARAMPNEVTDSRVIARESVALVCGEDGVGRTVIGPGRMPERLGTQVNCTSLDASEDGLLAATGYADGSVRAWRTDGARFASSLPHTAAVIMVRFLPESRHLLSIDGAGIIRVWDLSPAAPPRTVDRGYTWKAGFSPDGRRLALASGSSSRPYVGQGTIVDAATSEMRLPPLRHNGNVFDVAFSPDGRLIATASDDGTARLWDATSGEPVSDELAQDGRFVQVLFSSDGHRLLTLGSAEGPAGFPALLWEVPTARLIASLPGTEQVRAGEFSPDGQHLMIVTQTMNSKRVQIWRAGDGQPVSGASWPCDAAAFVSNTEIVIATSASLEVRNVDGRILATHDTATPTPVAVIRTNDGSAVVVLTDGGTSHVWNLRPSVAPRFPAWRLSGAMTAGGVSRDNRWFVGASWQRRMRVWSMETGEAMTPDRPVALLPLSASFSPVDSSFQVSGLGATRWELGADTRPDGLLERLVRLISGHELVGTELVPLSVARLIDLARDPALAVNPPPAIARNWRWLVATEHLRKREWAAAEIGLAALANEPEAILEAHVQHGFALAELGRWSESARAFETALARDPDSTELIYYEALALAAGGDAGAIDRGCRGSLQKFGATRNPDRAHWLASLCVLGDAADSTATARVRELSRIAADLEPDIEHFATVHATALIQDHQPSSAAALLDKVLELPALRDRGAHTLLVYALAQRTLGQNRAASESLARFETSPLRSTMPWHRRFEAETWLRQLKTGK